MTSDRTLVNKLIHFVEGTLPAALKHKPLPALTTQSYFAINTINKYRMNGNNMTNVSWFGS